MTTTHDWEGRFTERFLETGDTIATIAGYAEEILDFIRTEKEKSYQEGAAAERAKNNRVLYALALMWNQYCGVKGHLYMMAGEAALEELQRAGLLGDNHEEIDYKKIDALLTPINTV